MDKDVAASPVDAASKATRLLCAGVYLDPQFADAVVSELVTNQRRTVAPSYGYDAVPVVAHALAVRLLRSQRTVTNVTGVVAFFAMAGFGWIGPFSAWLLVLWLFWATAFLQRLTMLETLVTRLKKPQRPNAGVRVYPHTADLVPALVEKISDEQSAAQEVVHYGGYYPFVGSGARVSSWNTAVLLDGAPIREIDDNDEDAGWNDRDEQAAAGPKREEVTPFTVEELAEHVRKQLTRQLRHNSSEKERISQLTIERRLYGKAQPGRFAVVPAPGAANTETYSASRSYLCVQVGSWDQELVTSMFVGFDIKGDTLYGEFHVHVLPPVTAAFHALDRLPAWLDSAFIARVAVDVFMDGVGAVLGIFSKTGRDRVRQRVKEGNALKRAVAPTRDGHGEGLTRYAAQAVDHGARISIREMAASDQYHHFFQESDAEKYTKIVERRLLETIRGFLKEHHVDLKDYDARQTNILNRYGDIVNNGDGNVSIANRGVQSVGHASSAQAGEKSK